MRHYIRAMKALRALRASPHRPPAPGLRHWSERNNCQAYALDSYEVCDAHGRADTRYDWLQPGQGSILVQGDSIIGHLLDAWAQTTPEGADLLWQADGLLPHLPGSPPLSETGWEVAGFVALGEDFHLVRKDPTGRLSHKPGTRPVTRSCWGLPLWIPLWMWRGRGYTPYRYVGSYWYEPSRYGTSPDPELIARVSQFAEELG